MSCVMVAEKSSGCIIECLDYPQMGNQSLCIFIACAEVDYYLCLKYFLKKGK